MHVTAVAATVRAFVRVFSHWLSGSTHTSAATSHQILRQLPRVIVPNHCWHSSPLVLCSREVDPCLKCGQLRNGLAPCLGGHPSCGEGRKVSQLLFSKPLHFVCGSLVVMEWIVSCYMLLSVTSVVGWSFDVFLSPFLIEVV